MRVDLSRTYVIEMNGTDVDQLQDLLQSAVHYHNDLVKRFTKDQQGKVADKKFFQNLIDHHTKCIKQAEEFQLTLARAK